MTTYGVGDTYAGFNAETSTKGYYIDIPVWFRTSVTKADVELAVVATISQGRLDGANVTGNEGDLYKAARVAILNANSAANTDTANKIIYGSNFYGATADENANPPITAIANAYYNRYDATACGGTLVTWPQAVKAADSLGGVLANGTTGASAITNADDCYGTAQFVTQATATNNVWSGDTVVTVTKVDGANYGNAVEKTIRVWLEGEDQNCWNPNAGQSFTVDLRFVRTGSIDAATAANQTPAQNP